MPRTIYIGEGVPHAEQLLEETRDLQHKLKDIAKKEQVTLDQILKTYKCKVNEYQARMLYQCADSEMRIASSIRDIDITQVTTEIPKESTSQDNDQTDR